MAKKDLAWLRRTAWRWQGGRQGGGYEKLLLAAAPLPVGWDLWLLRYPTGSGIGPHRDPLPGKRHLRVNLVLQSGEGGRFECEPEAIRHSGSRLHIFRPDLGTHSVSPVTGGTRWVLSLGLALSETTS